MEHHLQHVAIIMDGNRRWAKERGLPVLKGHEAGLGTLREIVQETVTYKIPYLTVYAFSSENWNRQSAEVSGLFSLMEWGFSREMDSLHRNNIRVVILGDRAGLPSRIRSLVEKVETLTCHNTALQFNIALNYGARQEITLAVRAIVERIQQGKLLLEDLTEKAFETFLQTANIPDPDLLIRTGGEIRVSNFLLWQLSYAELYFTKTHWPAFSKEDYRQALEEFNRRQRRFGEG